VDDRRIAAEGQRQRFTSQILPSYMRRAPKVMEVLPILCPVNLRGLSTGDFQYYPGYYAVIHADRVPGTPLRIAQLHPLRTPGIIAWLRTSCRDDA
jgi:hypothetical protein